MERKIIVEASCLSNPFTGIGKTIKNLLDELNALGIEYCGLEDNRFKGYKEFKYFNFDLIKYCRKRLTKEDVFLIPNNMGKFWRLPHNNTWVLVHDIIPLSKYGYKGIKRFLYNYKMSRIKKATKIIAISETVKKQLIDTYDINPEIIEVLYWHINSKYPAKLEKSRDYFLSIGTGEPRKNIEWLIKNWQIFSHRGMKLKLYGGEWRQGSHERIRKIIKSYNLENSIMLLGKVSEEALNALYYNAKGFIYPSLEEGFGLPPLEALKSGTPVILAKTPINYELYGSIAFFYSIGNVEELENAIDLVNDKEYNEDELIKFCENFDESNFSYNVKKIFG